MRLVAGPPGAGKTFGILNELREAIRGGRAGSVRLVVPTATLAQHTQNELAREGFVFPPRTVQTLNGFIDDHCPRLPGVSEASFYLMVERAARSLNREEFARVIDFPGLTASLAETIEEFSAAGCDSPRLAAHLPDTPLGEAFLAVYRAVEGELARRNLALRGRRIEAAARRIAAEGAGELRTVWFDGFHALPEPELRLIESLAKRADVTVTLSDFAAAGTRESLERLGFATQRLAARRPNPATMLVKAPNIERETAEIARRILAQAAAGREFREMAVVVRAREAYIPILRSTLARFGIPARFYFPGELEGHATVRFLCGAVEAMLANWDHEATLAALRLAPRFADSNAMDRFDFAVRERIPDAGLESLRELAGNHDGLQGLIGGFARLDDWRSLTLTPREWASRLQNLRALFLPQRPAEGANHELALLYRSQSAALDGFDSAVAEAARELAASDAFGRVGVADFWRAVKAVLRLTPLRVRDGRRNAVQVMSAHEARQWSVPVVFGCGLIERQFPQFHRPNPFFSEAARRRLNEAGIRVRTAEGFEEDERVLFHAAVSRASSLAVLSYPEYDARGDATLPSIFLEDLQLAPETSVAARPRANAPLTMPPREPIAAPALLAYLNERTAKLSPSGLESYLQCAFRYFGLNMMRLRPAPKRPDQRLNENYMLQGEIVHAVLNDGYGDPSRAERLFDELFEAKRAEMRIPNGYHTERLRNAMREDLLAFLRDDKWPRAEFESATETKFLLDLDETLAISGRIDRFDRGADGAYVIDYKYSGAQRTKGRLKDENLLQAPLYYLGAQKEFGVEPDGMFYIGLKKGIEYAGWSRSGFFGSERIPEDWLEKARARTLKAAGEIRAGRIEALPADADQCRYCDCRDVCRVETARGAASTAGGGNG